MPHYVRCLKPNDQKQPREYDGKRVLHQIRYLGLLDNVKVRRAGFAYRTTFNKFLNRYVIDARSPTACRRSCPTDTTLLGNSYFLLSGQTSYAAKMIWKGDDISGCRAILGDAPFSNDQWQIGKTKVFIRAPESVLQQAIITSIG
jgi:myosin I